MTVSSPDAVSTLRPLADLLPEGPTVEQASDGHAEVTVGREVDGGTSTKRSNATSPATSRI